MPHSAANDGAGGHAWLSPVVREHLVAAGPGDPLVVWIYFRDKGLTPDEIDGALRRVALETPVRTLQRRAKVLDHGALPVTTGDLPLAAVYLDQVSALGAELRQTSRWLNAASFELGADRLREIASLDCVAKVDLVHRFQRAAIPTPVGEPQPRVDSPEKQSADLPYAYGGNEDAMVQANVTAAHELGLTGAGVLVGMLDTGFRTEHEALDHVPVLAAWDFVNNDAVVDNQPGDPAISRNHGTMTLSTVAGYSPGNLVAPAFGASVVLAKTEDASVEYVQEEDFWIAGMEWAEFNGVDLISSSLGYSEWYTYEDLDGETAPTTIAADQAVARGVVIINSAGNDRNTTGYLIAPADGDSVITVGAVTAAGSVAFFSSPGPTVDGRIKPDVSALGFSNTVVSPSDDLAFVTASGTSFSCPLTAGVVALLLERIPSLTPMQIREALTSTASQAGAPDNDLGWGVIDAFAATAWFGPVIKHDPLTDTQDTSGPYEVRAVVSARLGVVQGSEELVYRINQGIWNTLPLMPTGQADTLSADIPGQSLYTGIEYYLQADGLDGYTTYCPPRGPDSPHLFEIDTELEIQWADSPGLELPDHDQTGLERTITIPTDQSGTIVNFSVDISVDHPDRGELKVELENPQGSVVTLHYYTGDGTPDLVGNYPMTLTPDGPGSLDEFLGLSNRGDWKMRVADAVFGNTGTWASWQLRFTVMDVVSPVGDTPVPGAMSLATNVPNPFNPSTEIRFEVTGNGPARLDIFDLRGRLVRTLLDETLVPGPLAIRWDGRDRTGSEAPTGTYFYRLVQGSESLQRKMLLLR